MVIRFSKTDVVDTKTLADLAADYEDGNIPSTGDTPILEVNLTEEEVGYIKSFVEFVESCKDAGHPEIVFGKEEISGVSAITITADVLS